MQAYVTVSSFQDLEKPLSDMEIDKNQKNSIFRGEGIL